MNKRSLLGKDTLSDLEFLKLMDVDNVTKIQIESVTRRIYDKYLQQWFSFLIHLS